jgi:thioredoxin-related protein
MQTNFSQRAIAEKTRRHFVAIAVYRLTLSTPLARELGIAYTPTFVLIGRGKEVLRIDSFVRPFHIAAALDYVASGAYRKEPSFQRYLQAHAERLRSRGVRVDLWN